MLVAAVIFAAVSAQASKARLQALGNSEHIVDIQEVFTREPDQALNYEAATVEFGGTDITSTTPEAEGGFIRKMGDSAWSMYLGRSSTTYLDLVNGITANLGDAGLNLRDGHRQQNPLQLTYASKMGDINWGAGLFYVGNTYKGTSSFNANGTAGTHDYQASKVTQNIMGVLVGANNGVWDVQLRQGLVGETKTDVTTAGTALNTAGIADNTTLKVNSTGSTRVSGGYKMDSMYFYGAYGMGSGEVKSTGTVADVESTELLAGVVNSHTKDGVEFFYGAEYLSTMNKDKVGAGTKTEVTSVPLLVGVEAEVASWLVLRGSLTQSLNLISQTKTTGGSATDPADDTTARVGAGIKWGKATVDMVLGMGSTGTFGLDDDGNNFAQASVTYNF
ncbi:MAG: hypothetical protein ACK5W9_13765 [Bdellovibrionales bacterium]